MAGKKITQLTSGSLSNLTLDSVLPLTYSGTTFQHNSNHLRQILVDSGSHYFTGSQFINGDLTISGSAYFGDNTNDLHRFTGSILVSGSVDAIGLSAKEYLFVSGFAIIGEPIHHSGSDPEALHVGNSNSYNIAHFKGDNEYYSQVYISNHSSGSNASSDLVVVADNGTETNHYIDLGINSSTYTGGLVGRENDAYLLNVGKDMYIGTVGGENHPSKLFLFGQNNWENPQITVSGSGQVSFNTCSCDPGYTYQFSGSAKLQNDVNIVGELTIGSVSEKIVLEISGGASQYEFDYHSGSVFYLTSSLSNNSYNVSNIPIEEQRAVSITFVIKQETTPYIASSYKINDETVTVSWAGNEQPTGNANKTDVIGLTALRVGSSWNVLGTFTTFG
jgi:hypothetical protein